MSAAGPVVQSHSGPSRDHHRHHAHAHAHDHDHDHAHDSPGEQQAQQEKRHGRRVERIWHGVQALLAAMLGVLAIFHLDEPEAPVWVGAYCLGALLALTSCKKRLCAWSLRILAVTTTVTMFLFFAGFFATAPYLEERWYAGGMDDQTLGLLLAAFAMIPVLSAYSCRMKRAPDHD